MDDPTPSARSLRPGMAHADRLRTKIAALAAALDSTIDQLEVAAKRGALSNQDKADLYGWSRTLDWRAPMADASASTKIARGLGVSPGTLTDWWRNGAPPGGARLTMPIGAGLLPPKGTWTVYLLVSSGRVVYIGTSGGLRLRLAQHRKDARKTWDEVEFVVCSTQVDALRLEGDLIYQHQPIYNRADRSRRRFVA